MTENDIDVFRAEQLLIKRHGKDGAFVAANRVDELLAAGDIDGQAIWKRIIAAIEELQRVYRTGKRRRF